MPIATKAAPKKGKAAEPKKDIWIPDTREIDDSAISLSDRAKKIAVKDEASYKRASEIIDAGNEILKQVGDTFDHLIKNAHTLHKDLLGQKKKLTDPVESVIRSLKRQMADWQMAVERERHAEEARLQAEAKKAAQEQALREAAVLEQQGEHEAAEQVVTEAIEAPAPAVSLPKFQSSDFGRTTRTVWKWKIVDLSKIPIQFLTVVNNASTGLPQDVSTAAIGALVRTLKNKELAEAQFKGGVEVWEDRTII